MSQNDQNRDRQNQDEGYQDQQDETLREVGDVIVGAGEPRLPSQDRSSDAGRS